MKNCFLVALVSSLIFIASLSSRAQDLYSDESRAVALQLMQQLAMQLKKELTSNGPVAAIDVCRKTAPDLAAKLSIEKGWRVTRVSLKTRNPLLGTPDAWEQLGLIDFNTRAANGEALDKMERAEIVNEPNGRYFRYMKALPVQPLCLTCHGATENIAAEVKSLLYSQYPHDQAIGYSSGQVRGAISVKRLLNLAEQ